MFNKMFNKIIIIKNMTIKNIILWLLVLIINCAVANNNLPNLGNETQSIMSTKEEIIIGKSLLHQLQHAGMIYPDLISTAYINHLGNNLLANTEQIDLNKFNFFIVNDNKEINAFAFFGGNIGIYPELIKVTESESELAAILAHEISHITQKHSARQLLQQQKLMPITIAGAIATAIINPHLTTLVLGSHMQHMLNFSRDNEQEADRIGIQILAKSGFDPQAMPNIFQRFSQLHLYQQKIPEYLLTHPMFESRISDALGRTKKINYKQFVDHLDYHLIKARINANSNVNKIDLLAHIETQLKNHRYNNYTVLKYEQALVLQNLHKISQAEKILKELALKNPENIIIQLSLANLQTTTNIKAAKTKLSGLIQLYPDYFPLVLDYAQILLIFNLPLEAKHILKNYNYDQIYELIEEPTIYKLLIACAQKLNDPSEDLLTQAKLLIITDNLPAANQKLDQALKIANTSQYARIKKFKIELEAFIQDLKS
ncbi:MAG: M48 family metalloprotease [Gammaproteobacteria bacterium]|jgi:predicted Zn-dependent protease